jgi:hypothetical protein
MEGSYVVTFKNRRGIPVLVPLNGGPWFELLPETEVTKEAFVSTTEWSRFSEVVYLPEDRVKTVLNKQWTKPDSKEWRWTLELENIDGASCEVCYPDPDKKVFVYKGIPVLTPCPITSPWIRWRKISWVLREDVKENPMNPKYAIRTRRVVMEREERPASELTEIVSEIRGIAAASGDKDALGILNALRLVK